MSILEQDRGNWMVLDVNKEDCCGCYACLNACPEGCIEMKRDEETFVYPKVYAERCIKCHNCETVCPALNKPSKKNEQNTTVYAAWNNDSIKRISSTSGGVVSALSEVILSEGGCVAGAYYQEDFTVAHMIGYQESDIELLKQSKYMQSDMGFIYREVKKALLKGKKVLFCGTPCHNAALRNYIVKDYENLYQLDFICRGVISPVVFLEYLKSLEKKYNSKVIRVQFKNKDYGWNRFGTKIWFENGSAYIRDRYHDPYMLSYLRYSVSLRPSCYSCHYKGVDRFTDITVGDFWGIAKKDSSLDEDKGTSLVMINTRKGQALLESIRSRVTQIECSVEDIPDGNMCLYKSPDVGVFRDLFFKDLGKKSFEYIFRRYVIRHKFHTLAKKIGIR